MFGRQANKLIHTRTLEFISRILCVWLYHIPVCTLTYGDEERVELCSFVLRQVAAQRHSERLAAVCTKTEIESPHAGGRNYKMFFRLVKSQRHTHLYELKPGCISVPVCPLEVDCSRHTYFLKTMWDQYKINQCLLVGFENLMTFWNCISHWGDGVSFRNNTFNKLK